MAHLLSDLTAAEPDATVYYLSVVPLRLARPIARFLRRRDGYPSGTPLASGNALALWWLFGAGQKRNRAVLARLAESHPHARWVLIGDDAGHDPQLFADFACRHPGRVELVAIRQVGSPNGTRIPLRDRFNGAAVVAAPNGEEMLPRLRATLGLDQPRLTVPAYRIVLDPDGRPLGMRMRRTY